MNKPLYFFLYLFCFLTSHAHADDSEQIFGDWKVGTFSYNSALFSYANTTNDSGSTLGVLCVNSKDSCVPYIVNQLSCEKEGKYPALISVDGGIASISMSCLIVENRYLFMLPEAHLEYIVTSNTYGVAFGTDSGKFKAAYFSLNGSAKAVIAAKVKIDEMFTNKQGNEYEKKKPKYKDTIL